MKHVANELFNIQYITNTYVQYSTIVGVLLFESQNTFENHKYHTV